MTFQADLLSYFGQQLIAHGAVLFAILTAAFTFMGRMRPRKKDWRVSIYVTFGAVLIAVALYTVCRIMWYGALVDSVVKTAPTCGCQNLSSYLKTVSDEAVKRLIARDFPYTFIALLYSSINDKWVLLTCSLMGYALSFAIYVIGEPVEPTYKRLSLVSFLWIEALVVLLAALFATLAIQARI